MVGMVLLIIAWLIFRSILSIEFYTVKEGTVAILESSGKFSRILKPGTHRLFKKIPHFESIRDIVPTCDFVVECEKQVILTKSLFPVTVDAVVSYRVADAKKAIYEIENWQEAVRKQVVVTLHDIICKELEGPAQTPELRDTIADKVKEALNDETQKWGVKINWVKLRCIEVTEAAVRYKWGIKLAERQKEVEHIRAEGERAAIETVGEAEAKVIEAVEKVKADARSRVLSQLSGIMTQGTQPPSQEVIMRYLDVVEKLSSKMAADTATALRYIRALEKLSESEGARVIIAPTGSDLLIDTREKKAED